MSGDLLPPQYKSVTDDVDEFLYHFYQHKRERGFRAGLTRRVGNLIAMPIVAILAILVIGFIDWGSLMECPTLNECGSVWDYVDTFSSPWTFRKITALLQLIFLALWWGSCLVAIPSFIRRGRKIKRFYADVLQLQDDEVSTESWATIVGRLQHVVMQHRDVPNHAFIIHLRLLRHDNFWVGVYALKMLRTWTFCTLDLSNTSVLFHLLDICILSSTFTPTFPNEGSFGHPTKVRRILVTASVLLLVFLPGLLPFFVVYYVFKHAEEFHTRRMYMGPRTFSTKARWLFREFNEMPHAFERRIGRAGEYAAAYLSYFVQPVAHAIASVVVLVAGFALGVLLTMTIIDESILLGVTLFDHNLLWYMGLLTLISAAARQAIPRADRDVSTDAPTAFWQLSDATHYYPETWRNRTHTFRVRNKIANLFPYKVRVMLIELLAIVAVPLFVIFCLKKEQLETFMVRLGRMSHPVGKAGHVCIYSTFSRETVDSENGAEQEPLCEDMTATLKMSSSMVNYRLSGAHTRQPGEAQIDDLLRQAESAYIKAVQDGRVQPWMHLNTDHQASDEAWFYWLDRVSHGPMGAIGPQ